MKKMLYQKTIDKLTFINNEIKQMELLINDYKHDKINKNDYLQQIYDGNFDDEEDYLKLYDEYLLKRQNLQLKLKKYDDDNSSTLMTTKEDKGSINIIEQIKNDLKTYQLTPIELLQKKQQELYPLIHQQNVINDDEKKNKKNKFFYIVYIVVK